MDRPHNTKTEIPEAFLKGPAPQSLSLSRIDFLCSPLPEYEGLYAVIIDDVFTAEECKALVELADARADSENGGWQPALIDGGGGQEMLSTDYRNSDRVIWSNPELMGKMWERCLQAPGLREELALIDGNTKILGVNGGKQKWVFTRPNERMRFLRYGKGQFFGAHCDGSYKTKDPVNVRVERALLTIQVYLNDDGVEGGATTFVSFDKSRSLDVEPKRGRVLLFQHKDLIHVGSRVRKGIKYTMRSDLMYGLVDDKRSEKFELEQSVGKPVWEDFL